MTAQVMRLSFAEYVTIPRINASALHDVSVSPLLYAARLLEPKPDTDTLRRGRAAHTQILEPDRFLRDYALWTGRRAGKEWKAFQEVNVGRTILTDADYELSIKIRQSVRGHPCAARLLSGPGHAEGTILWTHQRTGLLCKSRIDWLGDALVDIKTTRDPSPHRFAADAARLGYDLKLAFYADAVAAAGFGAPPVKIVAAQNVLPYDVVVYHVPEAVLQAGRVKYEAAIDRMLECRQSGAWPGIAPEEIDLVLPTWAVPESEDQSITFGDERVF